MDYEVIIGFETHVELKTASKLFCDCAVKYEARPNSHICPVCTGQPGALPVLNKKAVGHTIRVGLALNCSINRQSRFARKNYFYPDLPKGYQISQYERPFCENGFLEIPGDDGLPYTVGIKRIHLEEDAGKLVHSSGSIDASDQSFVDYNRSSVPLLEIVTDHERNPLRSASEARIYLEKLRQTLKYLDISDCIIEKGQFRCDVNISIRPTGTRDYGQRAEIKNMASFKFIMEALEFEIKRQTEIVESGGEVSQETRLFDEEKRITITMRSKEDAPDYRYFPDPDLMEINLDSGFIQKIKDDLPVLPDEKVRRLIEESGIPKNEAYILTKDKMVSDFFSVCAPLCIDRKKLARWIIKELFRLLKRAAVSVEKCRVKPDDFAQLINLISGGRITEQMGRTVLEEMFNKGGNPESIVDEKGLQPIKDLRIVDKFLDEVINENPVAVSKIKEGNKKPIGFLIGQVMMKTGGKANPKEVNERIHEKLAPPPDKS